MLTVTPLADARQRLLSHFAALRTREQLCPLSESLGRVLAHDILADSFVPDFNRSTVDGYAVVASDVFGCSDAIPALLSMIGTSIMGQPPTFNIQKGQCAYVPTGGQLPLGADAMVMLEYAEDFGDGQIAIFKPAAPSNNIIFRGDDTRPGALVLPAGRRLNPADIGAVAAMGVVEVPVMRQPRVGIISTGDELLDASSPLTPGMIRDINAPMLSQLVVSAGGQAHFFGIIGDDETVICAVVQQALIGCDMLILSGGTSVGEKDAAPRVVKGLGELLVHGLAVKPGKPTLFGDIDGKPVFGLPGNPVAAYFMFHLLVRPLLCAMLATQSIDHSITLPLSWAVSSNHGREEFIPVRIREGQVEPMPSKSGLITTLAGTDGFIRVPRDTEGFPRGANIEVTLFAR